MNRRIKQGAAVAMVVGALGVVGAGCLTRPITNASPVTKTNFTAVIQNTSVDKVDLLFMIDNSASMGDKQALLAAAVPDMITRLVAPNCVDATTGNPTGGTANPNCPNGSKPEFPAVHDMHIGIVTSSLGARGGDVCPPNATNPTNPALNAHNDDRGELINRGGVPNDPTKENTVADATPPDDFLSFLPNIAANAGKPQPPTTAITSQMNLIADFKQMIEGVHEHGCGFEAQNEAWYRFLIQPDPFDQIAKGGPSGLSATLTGIDATILRQRADFLRPDSLVAVIVVTDENEEVADPLAVQGQGWAFENYNFPGSVTGGGAPEGSIECSRPVNPGNATATGPYDPQCTSCAFLVSDPNFATRCPPIGTGGKGGYLGMTDDNINVRFWNQKQRFGLFVGYPVSRYVRGLTRTSVPDELHAHDANGNYIGDQDGQATCVNPLFAQTLPTDPNGELCALTRGPRTPDLIYYAAIAGVPHELLETTPGGPQKDSFTDTEWDAIQGGHDPEHYDFTGADFHMIESTDPRTVKGTGWVNASACAPTSGSNCDPINGREFVTGKGDLQFSCIFDLKPQFNNVGKDCTQMQYMSACDCAAGFVDSTSALCQGTTQVSGKAYPSIREMMIAHAMSKQGAGQGIVSSICPIHVSPANGDNPPDPLYGYRPAVNAIITRLKASLSQQCLPQKLTPNSCGSVPCLVLVSMTQAASQSGDTSLCKNPGQACDATQGLFAPTPDQADVWSKFCDSQEAAWKASGSSFGPEPYTVPVCQLQQLVQQPMGTDTTGCDPNGWANPADFASGSCAGQTADPGWCYATGAAAGGCGHSILFTNGEPPHGTTVSLQCIEQSVTVLDGGNGG